MAEIKKEAQPDTLDVHPVFAVLGEVDAAGVLFHTGTLVNAGEMTLWGYTPAFLKELEEMCIRDRLPWG